MNTAMAQRDSVSWQGQRDGLIAPLEIPLILAGNFGELRENHFHTGLDFKTEGREGLPVIAADLDLMKASDCRLSSHSELTALISF